MEFDFVYGRLYIEAAIKNFNDIIQSVGWLNHNPKAH
jgi:hypothetical protein